MHPTIACNELSAYYTISVHAQKVIRKIIYTSVQDVPCDNGGAMLKAVLDDRDTDRTSYLRHDEVIAYEMTLL